MNTAASHGPAEIVIDRRLSAPPAQVFAAWTDPAQLPHWWGPDGFRTRVERLDPRPGGRLELLLEAPDGSVHPCRGTFSEVRPGKRLTLIGDDIDGHPCGAGLPPASVVTVTFEADGDGTRLTLRTRLPSPAARDAAREAGFEPGWRDSLDALDRRFRETAPSPSVT